MRLGGLCSTDLVNRSVTRLYTTNYSSTVRERAKAPPPTPPPQSTPVRRYVGTLERAARTFKLVRRPDVVRCVV